MTAVELSGVEISRVHCPTTHIIQHFGDHFPS